MVNWEKMDEIRHEGGKWEKQIRENNETEISQEMLQKKKEITQCREVKAAERKMLNENDTGRTKFSKASLNL